MSAQSSYARILSDPAFLVVLLLALVGTLGTNVLSAALPGIATNLNVSDARVGLVLSTFKFAAMVATVATSVLADLYGRRPVVLPSLIVFGIAGVAMFGVDSFPMLLGLCVLLGVGFAGVMPLSIALIGDVYSGEAGSTAQGIRTAVGGLGVIAFPALTGFLAGSAWNLPFLLFATALPVVLVAYRFVPEVADETERGAGIGSTLGRYAAAIRSAVTRTDMALLLGGGVLRDFVRLGVYTFVPLFAVRVLDASLFQAGAVLSLRGVAAVLVSPTLGLFVAAFSRKRVLVASFGVAAAGVALLPLAPTVLWLGAAFAVYSVGDAFCSPIVKDAVTDTAAGTHRAGVVGALNVLKNGGQAAAPAFFGGVLALSAFDAVFLLAAFLAAVYGVAAFALVDPAL